MIEISLGMRSKMRWRWGRALLAMLIVCSTLSAVDALQSTEIIGKDGAPMMLVQAGEFLMGSNEGDGDEMPAHRVYLDGFYMDKYEVTVRQYAKFLGATILEIPPEWNTMNQAQHQKRPVAFVNWADANAYCRWAGKRLPTESEWEKAARGLDSRTYPWGNEIPTQRRANFAKHDWNEHAALVPVGLLDNGKSPYGIYDLAGNVREWVADWYDANYYEKSPDRNPKGPERGEGKVLRGGSWLHDPEYLRSAYREPNTPLLRVANYGFRCAKNP